MDSLKTFFAAFAFVFVLAIFTQVPIIIYMNPIPMNQRELPYKLILTPMISDCGNELLLEMTKRCLLRQDGLDG